MTRVLLFLIGILSVATFAQDGRFDSSFGDSGFVLTDLDNSADFGWNVAQQADGKLVVSGSFSYDYWYFFPFLIRYLEDGSVDTSFGTEGKVFADHGMTSQGYIHLFIDNQQKIIVGTQRSSYGSDPEFYIVKYDSSGIPDASFGTEGSVFIPYSVYAMTTLNNGSFLLLSNGSENEIVFHCYLPNGTIDSTFGTNGIAISDFDRNGFATHELKTDSENNIYLVGSRDHVGHSEIIIAKFRPDGYLDSDFANEGIATKNINGIESMNSSSASLDFTNDNKLVVSGSIGNCLHDYPEMHSYILKYQNNGFPDESFGNQGIKFLSESETSFIKLFIQKNQKMILIGQDWDCIEGSTYTVQRYHADGSKDTSFFSEYKHFDYSQTILQEDGKIVSVGNTYWFEGEEDIVLLRHNNNTLSTPAIETGSIRIFPNPSRGIFSLERDFNLNLASYQISDRMGRIISQGELENNRSQIDLSYMAAGIYFLKTLNHTFKLVKN